jgi:hypothetical protein
VRIENCEFACRTTGFELKPSEIPCGAEGERKTEPEKPFELTRLTWEVPEVPA